MGRRASGCVLAGAVAIAACRGGDVDELKKGQQDMLARIEGLERTVQQIGRAAPPPPRPQIDPSRIYDIPIGSSAVRGARAARVTIVEFSDFQCPFCAQSTGLIREVLKAYPRDVRLVYKNFPLPGTMHPDAEPAARAAIAAGKQGKFWEMHDLMFQNMRGLGAEQLREYAGRIGLDVARWEQDFASPDVQQQVEQEMAEGRAADVTGTPTFFVNGRRVMNRSFDGFRDLIEAALKEAGRPKG